MSSILVVGDLMIDNYLWGKCDRISPEAPVQVVDIKKESSVLGGAGNVINNLIALGSDVSTISVIGDDKAGQEIKNMLTEIGAKAHLIVQKTRNTSKKTRIIASHQQVVRYDLESKDDIAAESEKKLIETFKSLIDKTSIVLLSDYGKGVLTQYVTKTIIAIAKKYNKKVIVDPKGKDYSKYKGAYLLTPNKKEASAATDIEIDSQESLETAIKKLKNEYDLNISLITLSEDGIAFFDDKLITVPTVAKEVFDVTGAGDTVLASLGYKLSQGENIYDSIAFANIAAGVVVAKIGSATATIDEIEEYKNSLHKSDLGVHIKTKLQIENITKILKNKNKKIVFTNGCFDILHAGHVSYLHEAKKLGDTLIVGLNSDDSIKRLKGASRPINSQEDRAVILSALESVDYVVIFEEDTPLELITIIKPDILVKGADYKNKEVVGSNIAKEIRLIDFIEGKSTTAIIEKIGEKKLC